MGLDGVELVMAVEEEFDISIDDAAAGKLLTPRLLTDYVLSKVTTTTTDVCLTQRAFNLLRKSLIRHGGWKRSELKSNKSLSALLPKNQRRKIIQKAIVELGIQEMPELVRPKWLTSLLFVAAVLLGLAAVVIILPSLSVIAFLIFASATIMAGLIGAKLTAPFCREFPPELQTIGDFARWVMSHKIDLANATTPGWTREQVRIRVREIIVEQLGVKPNFSDDAHFVKDLGVD